jgi:hypothetical protein
MNININLLQSDSEIRIDILKEISKHIDNAITKSISDIKKDIENIIMNAVKNEPQYISLKSGRLRDEFGIPEPSVVDLIINKILETINIHKKNTTFNNRGVVGGIVLTALSNGDIINLTNIQEAFVVDSVRGYSLPWLKWLLLEGVSPIVKDYKVKFGASQYSRTGMAVMVDSNSSWSVPPIYAGIAQDNWLTRAIDNINGQLIESSIKNNLEKNL